MIAVTKYFHFGKWAVCVLQQNNTKYEIPSEKKPNTNRGSVRISLNTTFIDQQFLAFTRLMEQKLGLFLWCSTESTQDTTSLAVTTTPQQKYILLGSNKQ